MRVHREQKIYFKFSIFLIAAWCPILEFAQETTVYFTNNTAKEIKVSFNSTHQFIKPYATNAILQVTRDGQWTSGQKDKFTFQINHPNYPNSNQSILYTLEREGTFLSSHIKNFLQLTDQNVFEFLKKVNFIEKKDKFWGNNYHFNAREWLLMGHIYDDIQIVIEQTPNCISKNRKFK